MRAVCIWATGLLASGLIGLMAGHWMKGGVGTSETEGVAAMLVFACARLWAGERRGGSYGREDVMRVSVIVQLKSDATMERLRVDVPGILSALQRHSDKSEMIFRSSDGRLFGWFLRTDNPLRVIQSAVTASPHFINGDTILLYEIGDALDGHGFTRQWTWLQHTAK